MVGVGPSRERTAESIMALVATVTEDGAMPAVLGGDHYWTFWATGDSTGLITVRSVPTW